MIKHFRLCDKYCYLGGGGQGSTTSTQAVNQAPWAAQQPFLEDVFGEAQSLYESDLPQYFPDSTVTPFGPESEAALTATQRRAIQGSDVQDIGRDQFNLTQSGGYLNANPYLGGAIDSAIRPLERNYRETTIPGIASQFGRSGAGAASQSGYGQTQDRAFDTFLQNVGDVSSKMAFGNYANERGMQNQAIQASPGFAQQDYNDIAQLRNVGTQRENQEQAFLQDRVNRFNFGQQTPANKLAQYSGAVGGPISGQTQSSTTTPFFRGSPGAGAAGGALSGASTGAMFGPWGALAGAGVGAAGGAASSKIICDELYKQGLLPKEIWLPDEAYGDWLQANDPAVLHGYHWWAEPIVARMRKSHNFAIFMSIISRPVALELGRRMGVGKGSLIGRLMLSIGEPVCRWIGREYAYAV